MNITHDGNNDATSTTKLQLTHQTNEKKYDSVYIIKLN